MKINVQWIEQFWGEILALTVAAHLLVTPHNSNGKALYPV